MNKDLLEEAAIMLASLADRLEENMKEKAALRARIETLEADIAASEHNFRTMRQLRNEAADRIRVLEKALREIAELCDPSDCPDGALLTIDRISRFALGPKHYRAALAPEPLPKTILDEPTSPPEQE